MRSNVAKLMTALCLICVYCAVHAGSGRLFNVTATDTPVNIQIQLCLNAKGPMSCQNFTVSGLALSILTTIPNHQYSNAGIRVLTPGYTFQTGCTPIENGYCTFTANSQTPTAIVISSGSTQQTKFAYVGSDSINELILCLVNATSGALTDCVSAGGSFTTPSDVAFNAVGTRAYISSETNGVGIFLCDVNGVTGRFSNCIVTGTSTIEIAAITLNPAGDYAYLSDYSGGNTVFKCAVNPSTGALSPCTSVGPISFQNPATIVFNPAGTLAYVGSRSDDISLCNVNTSTGAFSACIATAPGVSDSPMGIALNHTGTLAYVTDASANLVYVCAVNQSTGALSSCVSTGSGFAIPNSIEINITGTIAYIANEGTNSVTQCNIDSNTGLLSGCVSTGSGFSTPTNITLL